MTSAILDTMQDAEHLRLFAHANTSFDVASYLQHRGPLLYRYAERALMLAGPDDLVCVVEPPAPASLAYWSDLGLELPELIAPRPDSAIGPDLPLLLLRDDAALERIASHADGRRLVLDPYIATHREFALARALSERTGQEVRVEGGGVDIVAHTNRKREIRAEAAELGIPLAPGEVVELETAPSRAPTDLAPLRAAIDRQSRHTGRVIVRGSSSAAGSDVLRIDRPAESTGHALALLVERAEDPCFLVEAFFPFSASPNVLLRVPAGGGEIVPIGVTDQQLDERLSHLGNVFPSRARHADEMVAQAVRLAARLQARGYTGMIGMDFIELSEPAVGTPGFMLAEVNGRTNAAAYALALGERIRCVQARSGRPSPEAIAATYLASSGITSFDTLRQRCRDLLFDPRSGAGAIPYNTGLLAGGKVTLAVLGATAQQVEALLDALRERLGASPIKSD